HQDHERGAAAALVGAQEREPVHVGHAHIAQDQIEGPGPGALERAGAASLGDHVVARVAEQQAQRLAQPWLVVDDQYPAHRCRSARGKNILNAAPPSRAVSTHTTPPMSSTARATIARPSPVPRPGALVV